MADAGRSVDDAATWMPPDPVCEDNVWKLAPGFLLARRVDYVADRETPIVEDRLQKVPIVWSEAGMPCASASDRERCLDQTKLAGGIGRHLVTTAGDTVSLWDGEVALNLLGAIDTPAEALWWASAQDEYVLPCDVRWKATNGGYQLLGALSATCGPAKYASPRPLELFVGAGGVLNNYGPIDSRDRVCVSL